MKLLLAVAMGLALLFSLLITGLTAMDRLAPLTAAAIIDRNGLQQSPPCWYGVCPGHSTLGDVETILPKNASHVIGTLQPDLPEYDGRPPTVHNPCVDILVSKGWQACFYQSADNTPDSRFVEPITLWSNDNSLRLGDVMSVLGLPDAVYVCRANDLSVSYEEWTAQFIFKDTMVVTANVEEQDVNLPPDPKYFSPRMRVNTIVYYARQRNAELAQEDIKPWWGFTVKNQRPDLGC